MYNEQREIYFKQLLKLLNIFFSVKRRNYFLFFFFYEAFNFFLILVGPFSEISLMRT